MLKWFISLVKRHQWRTWWDKDLRRNRIACDLAAPRRRS